MNDQRSCHLPLKIIGAFFFLVALIKINKHTQRATKEKENNTQ
jgi:hypothetical protein